VPRAPGRFGVEEARARRQSRSPRQCRR
jgi:hypothetical protein